MQFSLAYTVVLYVQSCAVLVSRGIQLASGLFLFFLFFMQIYDIAYLYDIRFSLVELV